MPAIQTPSPDHARHGSRLRRGLVCAAGATAACLGIGAASVRIVAVGVGMFAACVGIAPAGAQGGAPQAPQEARPVEAERAARVAVVLERVEYVAIPPGEFLMGCSPRDGDCAEDEKPAHRVAITRGFEIGKHELTQAVWQAVMGNNPSSLRAPEHPVEMVSWDEVQEFLAILNGRGDGYYYRLPTEAEWEYAARAGAAGAYPAKLDDIAWYAHNSSGQTHPVGQKQPNAWGLHDMQGNVWEWCQDWYENGYYAEAGEPLARDPRGPASGRQRVLRGGSWYRFLTFLRVSSRFAFRPSGRFPHVGFRCVRQPR
jgi:formylglycine-generating enzyme required for sulfatase activity